MSELHMDSCRLTCLSCLARQPKEEGWHWCAVGKEGRNKPGTAGSMSTVSPPRPVRCHTVCAPFSLALFVLHLHPLAARLKRYRHPAPVTKIRNS
ncbi:hypothetical protein DFH08DRAFT_974768 [Mycena albidolilacea]|uniref:Uncharacterized protein n=1 Tax=Mycena albidolilacea TaxID=1033008 RepID=A0AAD6Z5Y4_9AGAR|nr:hypothetical protein DFH08DRAFT_974768 [Mycena albidolilacea]